MNFVNLKKILMLSSAVLAFGNVANAMWEENDPMKACVYNEDVSHKLINFKRYDIAVGYIKQGISENILRILKSGGQELLGNLISKLGIKKLLVSNKYVQDITNELINSRRQKQLNRAEDNFAMDKNSAIELLAIIQTMKDIKRLTNKDLDHIANNYQYTLFKDIANNITDSDMEKLNKTISDNYDKYNTSIDFSFLVATINEIIKSSKYMLDNEKDNLNTIVSSANNNTIFFKRSMNGKVFSRYTFKSKDGHLSEADIAGANIDENDYSEERNNLNEIMKEINTTWAMNKSEYNTVIVNPILKEKDIVDKIKNGNLDLPSSVQSADELLVLLQDIKNGKIPNKVGGQEQPVGGQIKPEQIDALLKKDLNNLTEEDKKIICELKKKKKQENLTQKEKELLDRINVVEQIQDIKNKIATLKSEPGIKNEDKVLLEKYETEIVTLESKGIEKLTPEELNKLNECKAKVYEIEKNIKENNDNKKYNIPGITDKLAEKGLKIANVTFTKEKPANAIKVIDNFPPDINGIINAGAGVVTVNTNAGIRQKYDKISYSKSITGILQRAGVFESKNEINELLENTFLNIEIA